MSEAAPTTKPILACLVCGAGSADPRQAGLYGGHATPGADGRPCLGQYWPTAPETPSSAYRCRWCLAPASHDYRGRPAAEVYPAPLICGRPECLRGFMSYLNAPLAEAEPEEGWAW